MILCCRAKSSLVAIFPDLYSQYLVKIAVFNSFIVTVSVENIAAKPNFALSGNLGTRSRLTLLLM